MMIGLPSMTIQRIQRNCLPPFAPPLHICQRLRPGEMPEKSGKSKVSLVATRKLVSPTTPTMNSPSQKIHSCSKGPDLGLTNLCYHGLVSHSVILLSHDHSSNVDLPKRSDEADSGGFGGADQKK